MANTVILLSPWGVDSEVRSFNEKILKCNIFMSRIVAIK